MPQHPGNSYMPLKSDRFGDSTLPYTIVIISKLHSLSDTRLDENPYHVKMFTNQLSECVYFLRNTWLKANKI